MGRRRHITSTFDGTPLRVIPSVTEAPAEKFRLSVEARLAEPDGNGQVPDFEVSPYLYCLYWEQRGRVPNNLRRAFADRDLATVRSSYAVNAPGMFGVRDEMVTGQAPWALTEHYSPDIPWYSRFYEIPALGESDYLQFADTMIPSSTDVAGPTTSGTTPASSASLSRTPKTIQSTCRTS